MTLRAVVLLPFLLTPLQSASAAPGELERPIRLEAVRTAAAWLDEGPGERAPARGLRRSLDAEEGIGFGGRGSVLLLTLDADLEYEREGRFGNEVALDRELPFDDDQIGAEVRLWFRVSEWFLLEARYFASQSESTGRTRNAFLFDKLGFSEGEVVDMEYSLQAVWAGGRILFTRTEDLSLGLPLGVLWTSQRLTLERVVRQSGGNQAEARVHAWSPYVGFHVEAALWQPAVGELTVEAEVLAFAYLADEGTAFGYLDLSAYLGYRIDHARVFLGPRVILHGIQREHSNQDRASEFEVYALVFGGELAF